MLTINIYFYLLMILYYKRDVVILCNILAINIYFYLLMISYYLWIPQTHHFRLPTKKTNPLNWATQIRSMLLAIKHIRTSDSQINKQIRWTVIKIKRTMLQIRHMLLTNKLITRLLTRLQFVPATCSYCNTKTTIR